MARKDYYLVLGGAREAPAEAIKKAFRELALRLHPDRAGEGSTSAFQEVQEAYDALSDPERRRRHDLELRPAEPEEWLAQTDFLLLLRPSEAFFGGVVPVRLPVVRRCAPCSGRRCRACGGLGTVEESRVLELEVPPGVGHGEILHLDLGPGAPRVRLRVRLYYDPFAA